MSKFWIQFSERWSRSAEKREKKDKAEKDKRKLERKALRTLQKRLEDLIKEIRTEFPDEYLETILCECFEILQTQIEWLLKREEKGDEP